jgi:hypothetical protein
VTPRNSQSIDHKVVAECLSLVAPAESAFRSRWRLGTLRRIDAELHALLVEQIDLFNISLVTGSATEAREHAQAMVRGWRAACAALEAPLKPDDAYLVGFDPNTGTRVVVAEQLASVARVQSVAGERVVLVTPDEVARMVAGMAIVAEAKRFFPDAEIMSVQAA